ncbi:MAG: membrane protein insertase YidC, partial [Cytophagaceae bacterium]
MDKNQTIGLVLITLLMLVYFVFFGQQPTPDIQVAHDTTTVQLPQARPDVAAPAAPTEEIDEETRQRYGELATGATGTARRIVLENELVRLQLNSHGGKIDSVLLKEYFTHDQEPLYLIRAEQSRMELLAQTAQGE